jgi:hypothetical protein
VRLSLLSFLIFGCIACGGAKPAVVRPDAIARLPQLPTVFIRFFGIGRFPAVAEPATYELCLDAASGHLVDVRAPGSHESVDDQVANVLRTWRWSSVASRRIAPAVVCWRERFTSENDAQGKPRVRTEPATPLRGLGIIDAGGAFELVELRQPIEDESAVSAMSIQETHGIRYVFLAPLLTPMVQTGGAPRSTDAPPAPLRLDTRPISGEVPRLPDAVKRLNGQTTIIGVYRVCADTRGDVTGVLPLVPLPGANASTVGVLKGWKFSPSPQPFCSPQRFEFQID